MPGLQGAVTFNPKDPDHWSMDYAHRGDMTSNVIKTDTRPEVKIRNSAMMAKRPGGVGAGRPVGGMSREPGQDIIERWKCCRKRHQWAWNPKNRPQPMDELACGTCNHKRCAKCKFDPPKKKIKQIQQQSILKQYPTAAVAAGPTSGKISSLGEKMKQKLRQTTVKQHPSPPAGPTTDTIGRLGEKTKQKLQQTTVRQHIPPPADADAAGAGAAVAGAGAAVATTDTMGRLDEKTKQEPQQSTIKQHPTAAGPADGAGSTTDTISRPNAKIRSKDADNLKP